MIRTALFVFRTCNAVCLGTFRHFLYTLCRIGMSGEHLLHLAAFVRASLFFKRLELLERKSYGPWILAVLLQEVISVIVGIALLLLRERGVEQILSKSAELRIGQGCSL